MTKDTNTLRFKDDCAPLMGALVFSCLLSAITIWFTKGAVGPWLAFLGLALALATFAFEEPRARTLFVPLFLGVSSVGLGLFSGGFTSLVACAVLWPLLSSCAVGSRFGNGLGASVCALVGLILSSSLALLPTQTGVSTQSGILALGVCGALALAACVRLGQRQKGLTASVQSQIEAANLGRNTAIVDAKAARDETRGRAQFMAEMSHEIRTPLNAILGFADTMREGVFGPLPPAYGDYPDLIHTSGTHLLDLVSDLLDLSKIEAGRYETNLRALSLDEIAYEGVRLSSGAARGAGVQLRHEASGPIQITADARALRQIVFNLISNALKFTPSGGRVTVRALIDKAAKTASLEVQDTGVGISAADLAKIGEPWNQVSQSQPSDTKTTRGSGLGLALVKRLTDMQSGQFEINSTLGEGTRVRVTFPLAPTSTAKD